MVGVAAGMALAAVVASCGSTTPAADGPGSTASAAPALRLVATGATPAQLDDAVAVLDRRFEVAGLTADAERVDDGIEVRGEVAVDDVRPLTVPGALAIRPVTRGIDCGTEPCGPEGAGTDAASLQAPARFPDPDAPTMGMLTGSACMDDSGDLEGCLTNRVIESASVDEGDGGPTSMGMVSIQPVFRAGTEGIELFNLLATACFDRRPMCATGRLALVIDDRVLSAPTMQEGSFERDKVQISGGLEKDVPQARRTAALLAAGPLPVVLTER